HGRRGQRAEAPLQAALAAGGIGLDAEEVEDVAVEDERERLPAPRRLGAEPAAEGAEVLVVEERLEAVVALRARVEPAAEVQVGDDDQISERARGRRADVRRGHASFLPR